MQSEKHKINNIKVDVLFDRILLKILTSVCPDRNVRWCWKSRTAFPAIRIRVLPLWWDLYRHWRGWNHRRSIAWQCLWFPLSNVPGKELTIELRARRKFFCPNTLVRWKTALGSRFFECPGASAFVLIQQMSSQRRKPHRRKQTRPRSKPSLEPHHKKMKLRGAATSPMSSSIIWGEKRWKWRFD